MEETNPKPGTFRPAENGGSEIYVPGGGWGIPDDGPAPIPAAEFQQILRDVVDDIEGAEDEPYWVIRVEMPLRVSEDIRDRIFEAVADAAHQAEPEDRDWDMLISAHPEGRATPTLPPCDGSCPKCRAGLHSDPAGNAAPTADEYRAVLVHCSECARPKP